ncbi:MAG: hypothetical protein IPK60_20490 [Sandaracinaceae bacterium]|nr:hypothetical protein [Sandaracinaceae bacterium]
MKALGEVARTLALLTVGMAGVVRAAPPDWLYGLRQVGGCCLKMDRIDVSNGQSTTTWTLQGPALWPFSMTNGGERLITINAWPTSNGIVEVHPANVNYGAIGTTGLNNQSGFHGLEKHPGTGVLYYSDRWNLYALHPATGFATLVAPFSGFSFPGDSIQAIAIDATGRALAIGWNNNAVHSVYDADLATATLTWVGQVTIFGALGDYRDLAFSSTGELWASFYDIGLNPAARGLYKIDTNSFLVTLVRPMDEPYFGLAFVPETAQSTYCTAKANSLGCAPEISADGFPSPTATSGYTIRASNVRNRVAGSLAFTVAGRASTPLGGGTLCLATPLRKTGVRNSAGSPAPLADCSGSWSLDFNTWMSQVVPLPAGVTVQAQWLGRDPGFSAPNNWTLSDALEFTMRL